MFAENWKVIFYTILCTIELHLTSNRWKRRM